MICLKTLIPIVIVLNNLILIGEYFENWSLHFSEYVVLVKIQRQANGSPGE